MNRYAILLIGGLAIAIVFVAVRRGNRGTSDLDTTGHIETRPIPSTQASTSPMVIESAKGTTVRVLSEQELREIAATNPAIQDTEWFKATTQNSNAR